LNGSNECAAEAVSVDSGIDDREIKMFRIVESFFTALSALWANKLRSLLTMLGIIIGVASVITMIGLGEGAQRAVQERMQAMGSNLLTVSPGAARGGGGMVMTGGTARLYVSDADALSERAQHIAIVIPEMSRNLQVQYRNRNWNSRVVGTTTAYPEVRNHLPVAGRFFTDSENRAAAKVAVLGSAISSQLYGQNSAVGETIRIAGQRFQVIGVLQEKGTGGWNNPDEQVFIPLMTAQRRLLGLDHLSNITVQVTHQDAMELATFEVERVLRREHRLRPEQENDFRIFNQADLITTVQETQRTFSFLLAGIAGVSLIVGGIGIMNIMIVSVTERTREIGIRKAVGARRRDVLTQFLLEAIMLSVIGGLIGIGTGMAASELLARFAGWNTVILFEAVVLSFVFAASIGIFFGMYPARKAAKQNVIESLRYE
jgi:putative ABC transport system permease protein